MAERVRVGLIGAGFVGNIHARAYRRLGDLDVDIAAIAAVPLAQAQEFARQYQIADVYDDYRRVLDRKDINLIDLCVPNNLHERFAIEAAQAGKHIVVEKPFTGYFGGAGAAEPVGATRKSLMLAEALQSADKMIAAAEQHRIKLMYAENWLYSPAIQKASHLVAASGGAILEIRAEESHSGSHAAYAKTWKLAGGGALVRLAAHPLGIAVYLKQQEGLRREGKPICVKSVTAEADNMTKTSCFRDASKWLVADWHDVENWCAVIVTFTDGSRALIQASDIVLGGMKDILQVYLTNARVDCDMGHSGMLKAYAPDDQTFANEYIMEKVSTKAGWTYPSVDEEWLLGYPQEMRDFVEAVAFDRAPLSNARLGREVVEIMYAAYQSAEEGRRVNLSGESK
ncbi:MAG: Gfo/Idh/MocA family oxidoreductase [Chloroflexota bacterium]